ncbi:hypothetical protein Gpo141_00013597 [Globisporangium polare]
MNSMMMPQEKNQEATASELNSATFLELVALMGSNKKAQVTVMTTFTATYKLMQLVEAVQYFEDTRGGVDWFALGKEARSGWLRDAGHESSHRQKRSRARAHGDSEGREKWLAQHCVVRHLVLLLTSAAQR